MRLILAALIASAAVPAMAEDLAFTLINNSSAKLVELYLSPHNEKQWGDNILNGQTVDAGTQGTVNVTDGKTVCDYDLRFVMDTGNSAEATQDLCQLETFTLHD